jgi:hypothetical protein
MKLNNGAKAIQWSARCGDEIEMPYVGKVLARLAHNDLHPFVVWSMTSEDGITWNCSGGDYCKTLDKALNALALRNMGQVHQKGIKQGTKIVAVIGEPVPAGQQPTNRGNQ